MHSCEGQVKQGRFCVPEHNLVPRMKVVTATVFSTALYPSGHCLPQGSRKASTGLSSTLVHWLLCRSGGEYERVYDFLSSFQSNSDVDFKTKVIGKGKKPVEQISQQGMASHPCNRRTSEAETLSVASRTAWRHHKPERSEIFLKKTKKQGRTDRWTDRRTDRQTDGSTEGRKATQRILKPACLGSNHSSSTEP